ncbi:MAG: TatD family hydrolase [Chloroflexi bacterium]|nr:TatD family hydrolase [Chloroflexota bacterium]
MTPPLVDSHLHLDDRRFEEDRGGVVAAAAAAGLGYLITIGTNPRSSAAAIELAARFPGVYASVGLHPNSASEWHESMLDELRRLAGAAGVVAIGEIGLDFYRDRAPVDKQRRAFEAQLSLAADLDLPIVIHDRDAHEDVVAALTQWSDRLPKGRPGVMHCFSGDWAFACRCLDLGFYLSMAGPLTYRKNAELHEVARRTPLDRLLVETDAPYLSPEPFRGRRNEPARVRVVAEYLAELREVSYTEVAEATTANVRTLFALPARPMLAGFDAAARQDLLWGER